LLPPSILYFFSSSPSQTYLPDSTTSHPLVNLVAFVNKRLNAVTEEGRGEEEGGRGGDSRTREM
jgi:hypothetical protein